MELVGAEYDDGNFLEYLLKMYNYSRQMAFPTEWFRSLAELYVPKNFMPGNLWYDYSVEKVRKTAEINLTNAIKIIVSLLKIQRKQKNCSVQVCIYIYGFRLKSHSLSGKIKYI